MLLCLTASHKNAGFDLLEKLCVDSSVVASALSERIDFVSGAVVVATCNRFEAYLDIDEPLTAAQAVAVEAATAAVSEATGVEQETLRASLEVVSGDRVAEHLFAVSSGLESVVVGEGEIAGQVRRSLEEARRLSTTSSELERLFQRASQTARGIKNRTGLGSAGRSIVRLALDLAASRVTDWRTIRVLLIGTGSYARATVAALRDRGVVNIASYSPSGRAEGFSARRGLRPIDGVDLALETVSSDIVITCTTTQEPVLDAALLTTGRLQGFSRTRQLVIDLGLPRNVAADVTSVAGVELLDLETISLHAPLDVLDASEKARALVGKAARKFSDVADEKSLTPAIVALRTHVFDALDAEIERARSRGDDGRTEQALRHLAGVLLHTPSVRARDYARAGAQEAYLTGLEALFGITVPAEPAAVGGPIAEEGAASA
ncbi:glutamyl-tRNA reductase [Rathayibacter toxicus]|uniref:Glutamyl-tRNA reductase n=1 Tax=Rathayibacter toxicus TaxID=145458 RepID=A0A0C5BFW8_9MICO|nr:glutamyl-tRNA reductase [Rathayibacter toxicus]AJM77070.1 glutamyl-tRNA reductase [Rathayibacter toxicus]ALS57117.1 glutamyl-tRNA reductase [Rathayibacter toxicus]KKM46071.1 glutamyl-tRNA reductase [Rathayibacter toxicus]PPG23005.1 glutamyl-tRNA reductase [Rathayibacter toxicus]PPG47587.1 glutamyl-tRNA reductase [Rathayibacter toxicus]